MATARLHSVCCQATFGSVPQAVGVRASVLNIQKAKSKPIVPCVCLCVRLCAHAYTQKMAPRNSNMCVGLNYDNICVCSYCNAVRNFLPRPSNGKVCVCVQLYVCRFKKYETNVILKCFSVCACG